MDQFLSRLPQSVIKEGKIIDVRSGLANVIKVCQSRHFLTLIQPITQPLEWPIRKLKQPRS